MKTPKTTLFYTLCLLLALETLTAQTRHIAHDMIAVPGGEFAITHYDENDNQVEVLREDPETGMLVPHNSYTIESFSIGAYCVSEMDYRAFCEATNRPLPPPPSWGWGDLKKPIVNVSYQDAVDFCDWMTTTYKLKFRLPTEKEWSYAANEAHPYGYYTFSGSNNPAEVAEYADNNRTPDKPNCITCRQPNALGIHDMSGNVMEWVHSDDENRAQAMGGSFSSPEAEITTTSFKWFAKTHVAEDIGFRVVAEPLEQSINKFIIEANHRLTLIFEDNPPFEFTKEGILSNEKLVDWNDWSTFFIDMETRQKAGFYIYDSKEKRESHEWGVFNFTEEKLGWVVHLQEHLEQVFWLE